MITINDVTSEEDDLTAEDKVNVSRINELRREMSSHNMRAAELDVLINAYATAVKNSVAPEEEVAEH